MKTPLLRLIVASYLVMLSFLTSCKKDEDAAPAPVITSFTPVSGLIGTSVTIEGANFSTSASQNTVTFNGTETSVISATASQMVVTVPTGATSGKITVSTATGSVSSTADFTVLQEPTISSFAPASGLVGVSVTITGTNFSTTTQNIVKFNNTIATVTSATTTQLNATVPSGATTGKISVTTNGATSISATDFTVIQPPAITSFTPDAGLPPTATGFPGTTVTILGSNFSSTTTGNIVAFNGVLAIVSTADVTQLVVTVPVGASTGKISVTVDGNAAESSANFTVLPTNVWSPTADLGGAGRALAAGFTIGTKIYIGTGQIEGNSNVKDFWEYDSQTNQWTQKADFGGVARNGAIGFAIGDKGYIGTGFNAGSSLIDFWEYNPASNEWTQKADFWGAGRSLAVGFTIGNKGYIGAGISSAELKDFWEYSQTTNEWTQKADIGTTSRSNGFSFVIGTKGYVGGGQENEKDFWEYNPATNEWTQKTNFPGTSFSFSTAFGIGTKGYVAASAGKLWRYDPTANEWVQKADSPISMASGLGFSIQNKGYMGTGDGTAPKTKKFFQYTPD